MQRYDKYLNYLDNHVLIDAHNRGAQLLITNDSDGQLWHHTFIPHSANRANADLAFGLDTHSSVCKNYEERVSAYLGFKPSEVESLSDCTRISFALPRDKAVLREDANEKLKLNKVTDETLSWLSKNRLYSSKFLFHQIGASKSDILRSDQYRPLNEVLELSDVLFEIDEKHPSNAHKLLQYIQEHPNFIEVLQQKLAPAGVKAEKFRIAGYGRTGVFLETEGGVVVAIRSDAFISNKVAEDNIKPVRQPIPQHLQPLAEFEYDKLHIEISPKLEVMRGPEEIDALKESIENTEHPDSKYCWKFTDTEDRNIGKSTAGTAYVIDGDAVKDDKREATDNRVLKGGENAWITDNGTWSQYEEFKHLHEAFNSPLHQSGGKLSIHGKYQGNENTQLESPSKTPALIALFAGAAAMIGGLFNLKKKESTEPVKEGEEKPKAGFSTAGIIATAMGAAATGWAIYSLVTQRKGAVIEKK